MACMPPRKLTNLLDAGWRRWLVIVPAVAVFILPGLARAGTFEICQTFDIADPRSAGLVIPAGSLFRDNGRADDPLAQFNGDHWQLRVETIADVVLPPLQRCIRVQVRITGDSSVKSVSLADNRSFIYFGSSNLLNPPTDEALLTLTGRVLDQVP